jgi:hypothetical protein
MQAERLAVHAEDPDGLEPAWWNSAEVPLFNLDTGFALGCAAKHVGEPTAYRQVCCSSICTGTLQKCNRGYGSGLRLSSTSRCGVLCFGSFCIRPMQRCVCSTSTLSFFA